MQILEQEPPLEQFQSGEKITAYLLEGKFESVFKNRIAPNNKNLIPKNESVSNKMLVFSDGDLIKNKVSSSGKAFPLGYNKYSNIQYNGNKRIIVNALNYILGNENIINIRSKEINLRLLDKQEIKNNRLKWQLINSGIPLLIIALILFVFVFSRKRQFR